MEGLRQIGHWSIVKTTKRVNTEICHGKFETRSKLVSDVSRFGVTIL